MTSHKDYRLDQLGIPSQYEADELERDLNVRFDLFAYNDREVWVQQNAYLDAYAYNRTVSDSADAAGVPVSIAQNWEYHNTLGFKRRLEIADLRFSDSLQVLALERVREPNAPASLLIELLRAHIPEKFSSNGHVCDTSKADEQLFFYSQDAQRELEAGHPTLRAIAEGTYHPRRRSRSHDEPSYTDTPSADAASNPADEPPAVNPPIPSPVLGEGGGEGKSTHSVRPEPVEGQFPSPTRHSRERGNPQDVSPHSIESDHDTSSSVGADVERAHDPSASSAPSAVNSPLPSARPEPVEGQFPSPTRHSRERTSPRTPIRGGNPQDISPDSIESDQDASSSHETPFPLPDDDIEPVDPDEVAFFNLSPEERKTTPNPSAPSAANPPNLSVRPEPVEGQFPSPTRHSRERGNPQTDRPNSTGPRLIASLFQKARPNPNDDHDTFPVKRF